MNCILRSIFIVLSIEHILQLTATDLNQTQSIIDLYKQLTEKDSLTESLALNEQAQIQLKSINTIRLLPLKQISINKYVLFFNIRLNQIKANEEIKLIELRLKLTANKKHKNVTFILYRRKRFQPLKISQSNSPYLSFDLTDCLFHNSSRQILIIRRQYWIRRSLQQASLIIYSRMPGNFLLPESTLRMRRFVRQKQEVHPCARYDLFVDFNQLSFGRWIIEPKRFNAGVCRGDCPNPLSRLYYPTNHAMLLSLLHERSSLIQQPSCVPVRLRPLDLLYYDGEELVIKRHQRMKVEECGCR